MTAMLERIGNALAVGVTLKTGVVLDREQRDLLARAALEAMREPTEEMLSWAVPAAASLETRGHKEDRERFQAAEDFAVPMREEFKHRWRAAIDVALQDPPA